jgi:hypothetical protein
MEDVLGDDGIHYAFYSGILSRKVSIVSIIDVLGVIQG